MLISIINQLRTPTLWAWRLMEVECSFPQLIILALITVTIGLMCTTSATRLIPHGSQLWNRIQLGPCSQPDNISIPIKRVIPHCPVIRTRSRSTLFRGEFPYCERERSLGSNGA